MMKVQEVIFSVGQSSMIHKDMAATKAGARPNGYLYDGKPVTPGFSTIIQPAGILSLMLVLDDGSIAFGDCVDVAVAGFSGRDRPFKPREHVDFVQKVLAPRLVGREMHSFRELAAEFDQQFLDGQRNHMAIRYGVTQALLHACAVARREMMVQVIAREYNATITNGLVPILVSCPRDNYALHDRMIVKRADLFPHAGFGDVEKNIGRDGQIFLDYVTTLCARIREVGEADYRPTLHFDLYGTLGELYGDQVEAIADYLARVKKAASPYALMIEAPIIAETRDGQVELYKSLREATRRKGIDVTVIVDEWCNTLEDVRAFAENDAADMVQIKTPDLGGINNTIEAELYCRKVGMRSYLGGSNNETDQSSKITTHIALACQPDFMLSKPGMGGDEALALQRNEMSRTLAVLRARGVLAQKPI